MGELTNLNVAVVNESIRAILDYKDKETEDLKLQMTILKNQHAQKEIPFQTTPIYSRIQTYQGPMHTPWEIDIINQSSPLRDPMDQSYGEE